LQKERKRACFIQHLITPTGDEIIIIIIIITGGAKGVL
jgi:hypothetical protein